MTPRADPGANEITWLSAFQLPASDVRGDQETIRFLQEYAGMFNYKMDAATMREWHRVGGKVSSLKNPNPRERTIRLYAIKARMYYEVRHTLPHYINLCNYDIQLQKSTGIDVHNMTGLDQEVQIKAIIQPDTAAAILHSIEMIEEVTMRL